MLLASPWAAGRTLSSHILFSLSLHQTSIRSSLRVGLAQDCRVLFMQLYIKDVARNKFLALRCPSISLCDDRQAGVQSCLFGASTRKKARTGTGKVQSLPGTSSSWRGAEETIQVWCSAAEFATGFVSCSTLYSCVVVSKSIPFAFTVFLTSMQRR